MKYVIIQPYFGKFPEWIDLFFYSCGKNLNVDFVFFTDCELTKEHQSYTNIRFVKTTYDDYCKMVSDRLNIDFHPQYSYKLCDLKPFLGVVHQDIISEYDCWGYCDIDLVLGDLSPLLSKMSTYDIISTHADRLSGHFTMIKTKSKYTNACFKIWRWKHKLMLQKNKCLDEDDLTSIVSWFLFYRVPLYYRIFKPMFRISEKTYYRITDRLLPIFQSKRVSFKEYHTTPVPDTKSRYIYETSTGKVRNTLTGKEIPYLHFLFFKKTPYLDTNDYWQGDYYQIASKPISNGEIIEINKKGIFFYKNKDNI